VTVEAQLVILFVYRQEPILNCCQGQQTRVNVLIVLFNKLNKVMFPVLRLCSHIQCGQLHVIDLDRFREVLLCDLMSKFLCHVLVYLLEGLSN
jgi:hypothetical protein